MGKIIKTAASEVQTREVAQTLEISAKFAEIRGQIEDEANNRANTDNSLQNEIIGVREDLQAEAVNRANDNTFIIAKMDSDTRQLNDNISDISEQLNGEVYQRELEDNKLRGDFTALIDEEKMARGRELQDTQNAILAAMGNEKALQDIEDEALRQQLSSETANLTATINLLSEKLETEEELRQNADLSLQNKLEAETSTRLADMQNLHSSLIGYVDEKIGSSESITKAYITEQIENVEGKLNDFTAPTATTAGKRGLVPEVPAGMLNGILTTRGWRTPDDATLTITTLPTQTGTLYYNKNVQSPTWLNFDDKKLQITGATTGTAAGSYEVTITPLDIYIWSDTLDQRGKTQNWQIEKLSLAKPSATVTEFDCDGSIKNLNISNYDATYIGQAGTVSASEPGTYQVSYSLLDKNSTTWNDGTTADVVITWKINLKVLTAAQSKGFSQVGSLTYSGNSQTVTIKNYDSTIHQLGGVTSAVNAGSYTATIAPKSGCTWNDGTTAAKNVSWSIGKKSITKPTASVTAFDYDGTAKTLQVANYDSSVMTRTGTTSATDAGEYQVSYSLKNTTNYIWSDNTNTNVIIEWSIGSRSLAKPTATTITFTYSGDVKSLVVSNYDSKYMVQSGTVSATNAGSYSVTYHLSNTTQAKWEDGTTADVVINWTINRAKLSSTQSTFSQTGTLTYSGNSQTPTIKNFDSNYHEQGGTTSAVNAGTYALTITPNSNYAFSNGSTAAKSVNWTITKKNITAPTASITKFAYDGAAKTLQVANYDKNNTQWTDGTVDDIVIVWRVGSEPLAKPAAAAITFTYDGNAKTLSVANYDSNVMTQSGTVTAVNAGEYSVVYHLKDSTEFQWEDGTTDDVTIAWVIERQKLSKSRSILYLQDAWLIYNRSEQNPTIINYDSTYHDWSGDSWKVTVGNYTTYITPKPNYCWEDGTTDAKTLNWGISILKLPRPSINGQFNSYQFEYTGNLIYFNFENLNSNYVARDNGTGSAKNTGDYVFTFSLRDKENTRWLKNGDTYLADGTDDYVFTISIVAGQPKKPTATVTTFTYDGNVKTLSISNYNSSIMDMTGTSSATNAGNYAVKFSLKNPETYQWEDGTTDDVTITWTIERAKLSAADSTFAESYSVEYDGTAKYATNVITPFNADYHGIRYLNSSPQSSTAVCSYQVYIDLESNYLWNDGTKAAKKITWAVTRRSIPKPVYSAKMTDVWTKTTAADSQGRLWLITRFDVESMLAGTSAAHRKVEDTLDNVNTADFTAGFVTRANASYTDAGLDSTGANLQVFYDLVQPDVGGDFYYNEFAAPYILTDKNNTMWADGTTDDVIIYWKMLKGIIARPRLSDEPMEYLGADAVHVPVMTNYTYEALKRIQMWIFTFPRQNYGTKVSIGRQDDSFVFSETEEDDLKENIVNYKYNGTTYRCVRCDVTYRCTTYWVAFSENGNDADTISEALYYIKLPDDLYPGYPAQLSMLAGNSTTVTTRDLEQIQAAVIDLQNAITDLYETQARIKNIYQNGDDL